MAKFCSKCGAQMDDNLMFCGNCGAKADAQPAPVTAPVKKAGGFDIVGILTGKGDEFINWIVTLGFQALTLILFFLPLFRTKVKTFATGYSPAHTDRDNWGFLNEKYENTGLRAFVIILIIYAILLIGYTLLPILMKKKVNLIGAIALFVVQSTMYLSVIFYTLKIGDVERSAYGVYKIGIGVWGWFYLFTGAAALYLLVVNVLQKKKELI
ncbi:MAG: zinc ribbon domain-containing protein [Ruminococcaceae bacterium]|nr:zinc ribbon domain-containing protein [Oscillospiraceae bacterium]